MNLSASALAAGLIFGACGLYFLRDGKSSGNVRTMLAGLTLLIYPYFIENTLALWATGVVLVALAWSWR